LLRWEGVGIPDDNEAANFIDCYAAAKLVPSGECVYMNIASGRRRVAIESTRVDLHIIR